MRAVYVAVADFLRGESDMIVLNRDREHGIHVQQFGKRGEFRVSGKAAAE